MPAGGVTLAWDESSYESDWQRINKQMPVTALRTYAPTRKSQRPVGNAESNERNEYAT